MTKPEDIPQRVWDEAVKTDASATEACLNALGDTSPTIDAAHEASVVAIARAIMAAEQREREACAGLAARDANSHDATTNHQTAEWLHDTNIAVRTADRIATAIRNRGENQGD